MKKGFFKPEDFNFGWIDKHDTRRIDIVEACNTKLNKLIESWPVVYGHTNGAAWFVEKGKHVQEQHTARLAFIEEIKKEPCKHEPANPTVRMSPPHISDIVCKHCGVELQATWEEKK